MAAVLRLKRKASSEPVDGLVIALKKTKYDEASNVGEVYFKFAATLKSETESVKDHIQAVLSKTKSAKWRAPKSAAVRERNVKQICEKLKNDYKAANEKKKLDLLNNRRLIFTESVPIDDDKENLIAENSEVRKLFQLYDIIEESEEVRRPAEEQLESSITCNDQPLIREMTIDYVYDVYIADVDIDQSFVENMVSVRPCKITNDDIYSGESDSSSECFEDEDDSNEESNWRNSYPEDEDSCSEKESEDDFDAFDCIAMNRSLKKVHINNDEEEYSEDEECYKHSRILQDFDDKTESDLSN